MWPIDLEISIVPPLAAIVLNVWSVLATVVDFCQIVFWSNHYESWLWGRIYLNIFCFRWQFWEWTTNIYSYWIFLLHVTWNKMVMTHDTQYTKKDDGPRIQHNSKSSFWYFMWPYWPNCQYYGSKLRILSCKYVVSIIMSKYCYWVHLRALI